MRFLRIFNPAHDKQHPEIGQFASEKIKFCGIIKKNDLTHLKGANMDTQVLIIGAGLSGLMATHQLNAAQISTLTLDKGVSVGGRLATRRIQHGLADHGAQFFTVRTAEFQTWVDQWMTQGLVSVWGYGWSDGSLKRTASDGHPRYVVKDGMNTLAKELAQGKNIKTDVEVAKVIYENNLWVVTDTHDQVYSAEVLVMTAPVPQSLKLLDKGHLALDPQDKLALERIEYGPCLGGMFVVDGVVNLPEPGAVQDFQKPVYWIADNQRKGISSQCIITLHAEARYSRENYDAPESDVLAFLEEALKPYLGSNAQIVERQLKKWRYSVPVITHPHDFIQAKGYPLFFAGDAFGGRGRVEGAFMSGFETGKAIVQHYKA
jgi:renalase